MIFSGVREVEVLLEFNFKIYCMTRCIVIILKILLIGFLLLAPSVPNKMYFFFSRLLPFLLSFFFHLVIIADKFYQKYIICISLGCFVFMFHFSLTSSNANSSIHFSFTLWLLLLLLLVLFLFLFLLFLCCYSCKYIKLN